MAFRSGRDFAGWIGLVPQQESTGANRSKGPISKQGDRYLRRILVIDAHTVLQQARHNPDKYPWLTQLLARRPFKVVAVALANKMAIRPWSVILTQAICGSAKALVASAIQRPLQTKGTNSPIVRLSTQLNGS
jgi:hypothetical protein